MVLSTVLCGICPVRKILFKSLHTKYFNLYPVRYLCRVKHLLHNPVYNALLSGDAALGFGTEQVKCFDEEVSPFVGFREGYANGFDDLYQLLPAGRKILYANPEKIQAPPGWQVLHEIEGLQFAGGKHTGTVDSPHQLIPLNSGHVAEMISLAQLTKPGPFSARTIDFGHYYGIFEDGKLVAMTGQRLHPGNYAEVSAVCTHPDYLGKGYAAALISQQLQLIARNGQEVFLHVRKDNSRAIAIYERLGFMVSRPMNFYFMKKQEAS